jgi:hypothetical protein
MALRWKFALRHYAAEANREARGVLGQQTDPLPYGQLHVEPQRKCPHETTIEMSLKVALRRSQIGTDSDEW